VKKSKRKAKQAKRRAKKRSEQEPQVNVKSLLLKRIQSEQTRRHMIASEKRKLELEREWLREERRKARGDDS